MFQNSTVPQTIVRQASHRKTNDKCKWNYSITGEKKLTIKFTNINLRQEPNEILDLILSITTIPSTTPKAFEPGYCAEHKIENPNNPSEYAIHCVYQYSYTLELKFHNCLHEFSKKYFYEVTCKFPVNEFEQADQCFAYCVKPRLQHTIKTKPRIAMVTGEKLPSLSHMYFSIRRHNELEHGVNEQKLYNIINTLRTVGCDVVLECRDGRIPAHKLILSQNSDVFSKMFTHQMKEQQNGVINMSDFEVKVVSKTLDYLYTRELRELGDMTLSLFKLAHLYQFNELCRRCEEYYIFNVEPSNDNIVDILTIAILYDLKELERCANDFAVNHEHELIQLPSYRQYLCTAANTENVMSILFLALKYNVIDVKINALDFIKANYAEMIDNEQFMNLFVSNPELMKEVYIHSFKKL